MKGRIKIMNRKTKTSDIVLAAMLTAISMLITFLPFKLVVGPFSVTPGSHVPTMIAAFINPTVAILTVVGSCIGFFISTGNILIVIRAATHIVFALLGLFMIRHRVLKNYALNLILIVVITSLIHAGLEAIVVGWLTPLIAPEKMTDTIVVFTFSVTIFHHLVDSLVTLPVVATLSKAGFVRLRSQKEYI